MIAQNAHPEEIVPSGPPRDDADVPAISRGKAAMVCFLCSESAFFGTLLVAYGAYIGASTGGPTPETALRFSDGLIGAAFLLPSSATVALAVRALVRSQRRRFLFWLSLTMALGVLFLLNTAREWHGLIVNRGLTLATNLFGTTFYTLVGFHAAHVTLGVIIMSILLLLVARRRLLPSQAESTELFSWYWHFVDSVWVAIVLMVYIFGD
jgi:cytochrome c oxidase subunit 3